MTPGPSWWWTTPPGYRYVEVPATVSIREDVAANVALFRAIRDKHGRPSPPDDELVASLNRRRPGPAGVHPVGPAVGVDRWSASASRPGGPEDSSPAARRGRTGAGIVRLSGQRAGVAMASVAERIGAAVGVAVTQVRLLRRQHGFQHVTGTLADGRAFFAKVATQPAPVRALTETGPSLAWVGPDAGAVPGPHAAAFTAEANGLRWLAAADGGPPVPRVLGVADDLLVIELVEPQEEPSPAAARRLGAALARMHAAGAAAFGAPWPGYIASLPLDNTGFADAAGTDWGSWYAQRRLVPYLRWRVTAARSRALTPAWSKR